MKSKVIGFARLLERGGKPDFFRITYIDAKHDDIKESIKARIEIACYEIKFIHFDNFAEISDKLFKLIGENNNKISIQIYILAEILKCFYDSDIDIFKEIAF